MDEKGFRSLSIYLLVIKSLGVVYIIKRFEDSKNTPLGTVKKTFESDNIIIFFRYLCN